MTRLNYEEKLAAVAVLSAPERPLQRIINAKDPRSEDTLNTLDSESLLETSKRRAKALIERQRKLC
jgi:hypothetical protein